MSTIDMCKPHIDIHFLEGKVINTLVKLHDAGITDDTLKVSNSYKETYVKAYNYYVQVLARK